MPGLLHSSNSFLEFNVVLSFIIPNLHPWEEMNLTQYVNQLYEQLFLTFKPFLLAFAFKKKNLLQISPWGVITLKSFVKSKTDFFLRNTHILFGLPQKTGQSAKIQVCNWGRQHSAYKQLPQSPLSLENFTKLRLNRSREMLSLQISLLGSISPTMQPLPWVFSVSFGLASLEAWCVFR